MIWKDREKCSFCFWDSVFRSNCYQHLATINSEKSREGSPIGRFYLTSFSWHSWKQRCLGMFPHCTFSFGGDQKAHLCSIIVWHSGYCKALSFRDNCFLESAYKTSLYKTNIFNLARNLKQLMISYNTIQCPNE